MTLCLPLFWSWAGVEVSSKEGATEKGDVEIEDWYSSAHLLALGFQEKLMQSMSAAFYCFFGDKEPYLLIPWLLNSSDLPSYGSELRKRYPLRLLPIRLEEGGVFEIILPGRGQLAYGKLYRSTIKWASSKTVFNFPPLRAPLTDVFWKSISCIRQKIHISE